MSADITLLDVQGSVFDAEHSGIVAEFECFFIGRKGEKDPLIGPYPSPYQPDRLNKHYTLNGNKSHIVSNDGFMDTVLCNAPMCHLERHFPNGTRREAKHAVDRYDSIEILDVSRPTGPHVTYMKGCVWNVGTSGFDHGR